MNLPLSFDRADLCASAHGDAAEGSVVTAEGWYSTDFVDVTGVYGLYYVLAARKSMQSIAFYDADRKYLSGIGTFSTCGFAEHPGVNHISIATVQGFTPLPAGTVYARFLTYNGPHDPMKDAKVETYADEAAYAAAQTASGPLAGKKIACLGDSLTEGDYGIRPCVANVHYRNYPFFLSRMTGATTVNYGRCGYASESYRRLLYTPGHVDVTDADAVILMLGSNLGLRDGLAHEYKALVADLRRDMKAGATLILVAPPHATEDKTRSNYGYNDNVMSAVTFLRAYTAEAGIPFIDAYADSPIQPGMEDVYQANDGLHMCEAGCEAFAAFMADRIIRILS